MKKILAAVMAVLLITLSVGAQKRSTATIRTGRHNITLQWISWTHPGSALIKRSASGVYEIEGEQRSAKGDEYLMIRGTLTVMPGNKLVFEGAIRTKTGMVNGGRECLREGRYDFSPVPSKKYWRLKQSQNCEGGMVTDYIDIQY